MDDNIDEYTETFNVVLSLTNSNVADFAGGGADLTAIGTILDNDQPPILEFASINVLGTEGQTADFVVNVIDPVSEQSTTSGKDISVSFDAQDGSAVEGSDFTLPTPDKLEITAGQSSGTIAVTLTDSDGT